MRLEGPPPDRTGPPEYDSSLGRPYDQLPDSARSEINTGDTPAKKNNGGSQPPDSSEHHDIYYGLRSKNAEELTTKLENAARVVGLENLTELLVSQAIRAMLPQDKARRLRRTYPGASRSPFNDFMEEIDEGWTQDRMFTDDRERQQRYHKFTKQLTAFWKSQGKL